MSVQAEAREALGKALGSLQYVRRVPRQSYRRTTLQFVPLQLNNEATLLCPAATTIVLNLFDYNTEDDQRVLTARYHRYLLEALVRLMSSPATQWNAFYDELWEPELMQRLRAPFKAYGSRFPDQRSFLETRDLPVFVLCMAADDLSEKDLDCCYEFLTRLSANVFSSEQREFLDRVCYEQRQIVVEIGLQLSDCKPTKALLSRLKCLFERIEATDRNDPLEFPVRFNIKTLWLGMSAFALPCDMDVLMDLSSISGICVQNTLTNQCNTPQEQWAESLEDFPPRVVLDPSTRSLDLSWLTLTGQHISSICSALRATDHIQEVSCLRRYGPDPKIHNLTKNEFWAWIAFGILHRESRSKLKSLDIGGMKGSTRSMATVSRILASPHPGKELVIAIDPDMESVLQAKTVPLSVGKKHYVSLRARTKLKKRPNNRSATVFAASSRSFTHEIRWEVLVKLNNGWICILVPAYGIAWVPSSSTTAESEKPSAILHDDTAVQLNPSLKMLRWSFASHEHVLHLLPMIGHSLESLSVEHEEYPSDRLESILNSCPNLKHFKSHGTDSASVLSLLRAYQEGRCKIEHLDISLDIEAQQGYLAEMALLLSDPSSKPLRQLSIDFQEDDITAAVDNLIAACHTNRTLETLQVHTYGETWQPKVQAKLDELNDQMLDIHTPSAVKWAFLSVVKRHRAVNDGEGMGRFDSLIISRIFEYAGSPIRRKFLALRY